MRFLKTIVLCLQLSICNGLPVQEIALLAYDVITLGIDFVDRVNSGNDLEQIQDSINSLQNSVDEIHEKLDYTTKLVEQLIDLMNEQPYKISLSQHIEKIKSCRTDLGNFMKQPTSLAARANFRKCYDIMQNVRAIGRYLSGYAIVGLPPLFELYRHKDGHYRGSAIKTMFQYLYANFIDGCAVVVSAERDAYCHSSPIFKNECWKTVKDINSYMRGFYQKCIAQSCSSFLSHAERLLNSPAVVDVSSANKVLETNYPWLQFLVLQTSTSHSILENNGTFFLNSENFASQKKLRVFWTDSFVSFTKNSSAIGTRQVLNVTFPYNEYVGSSFGMNISKSINLDRKMISFTGYTSDNTMDNCQYDSGYIQQPPASRSAKSSLSFFTIIVVFFLLFY